MVKRAAIPSKVTLSSVRGPGRGSRRERGGVGLERASKDDGRGREEEQHVPDHEARVSHRKQEQAGADDEECSGGRLSVGAQARCGRRPPPGPGQMDEVRRHQQDGKEPPRTDPVEGDRPPLEPEPGGGYGEGEEERREALEPRLNLGRAAAEQGERRGCGEDVLTRPDLAEVRPARQPITDEIREVGDGDGQQRRQPGAPADAHALDGQHEGEQRDEQRVRQVDLRGQGDEEERDGQRARPAPQERLEEKRIGEHTEGHGVGRVVGRERQVAEHGRGAGMKRRSGQSGRPTDTAAHHGAQRDQGHHVEGNRAQLDLGGVSSQQEVGAQQQVVEAAGRAAAPVELRAREQWPAEQLRRPAEVPVSPDFVQDTIDDQEAGHDAGRDREPEHGDPRKERAPRAAIGQKRPRPRPRRLCLRGRRTPGIARRPTRAPRDRAHPAGRGRAPTARACGSG